jgi:hypothetical protein
VNGCACKIREVLSEIGHDDREHILEREKHKVIITVRVTCISTWVRVNLAENAHTLPACDTPGSTDSFSACHYPLS